MLFENNHLIEKARSRIRAQLQFVETELQTLPADSLNFRPHKGSWSALECIEHLNLVFDWYIPQMDRKTIRKGNRSGDSYHSGFFGDRMVTTMEPKGGEIKFPVKTFRKMQPERSRREKGEIIERFKQYMHQLDEIVSRCEPLDLGKIRINSAIGILLRFKLGDCIRFLVAHNERHLLQSRKVLKVLATYQ